MSKAPITHKETFVATSTGTNASGAYEEGTVEVTYMGHRFSVAARKHAMFIALNGLTEGLKAAKKEARK